ncbi:MAG: hypothetical protein JNN08_00420 [Bryobacterales bacterium]|nr:hypothetical protein [Bryobacterales bacterium]
MNQPLVSTAHAPGRIDNPTPPGSTLHLELAFPSAVASDPSALLKTAPVN